MKTVRGTVRKNNLEGGIWTIETPEKKIYQLKDGPEKIYKDGATITVKGKIRTDMMGIGMIGPIFEVHDWQ